MYHILYVDDEPALLEIGKLFLEERGQFSVDTSTSAQDALSLLNAQEYDALISDYQMPDMDGIGLLKTIRSSGNTIPFILFTGRGREEIVIQALNEGADFYLQKGGDPQSQFTELANKVRYAVMRKSAEEALRESEERFRRIVETTDEGIAQMDENFNMVYVNRRMAKMHGCMPEELIGQDLTLFMAAGDTSDTESQKKERRSGKSGRYERRIMTKDGRLRWMQVSATPITDTHGTFRGSFAMCSDITDRKTAEEEIARSNEHLQAAYEQLTASEEEIRQNYDDLAKSQDLLKESEQRYRNVVEDQTEFISRFLPDGTHVFVNDAYCRYFGMNREEIIAHRFRPQIPAEERECLKQFFAALTPDHPGDSIRHRIIMPDGSVRLHEWSDRAIFDPSGRVTEYQSVGRDITEMKETEAALEKSEIRFREQYQNNPLAIFTWQHRDGDFVLIDCNRAAQTLTGGKAQDYIGITATGLYAHRPELLSGIRRCFSEQKVISKKLVSEHFLPGRHIHATAAFIPPDLIQVHMDDITEQIEAEEALRQANRQLSLLSGITRHDVLNKITAIHGYLKLAEMKPGAPGTGGYLEKIESALSEIRSQIEFNRTYQDPGTNEPQWLELDGVMPRLHVPETIILDTGVRGVEVFADPMLGRVFFNLLDNSIRHGQRVTRIHVSSRMSGENLVVVWEDNGTGVAADEKERIFGRGFGKNTGLGLFLVREILALTGITIRESGVPGAGASFEMTVPAGGYRVSPPEQG